MRTRPSFKIVAVWYTLAVLIGPVPTKEPEGPWFGLNSSALARVPFLPNPPANRIGGALALLPPFARPAANANNKTTNAIAHAPN